MSNIIMDESNLRSLSVHERFTECEKILQTSNDESLRWDAVWLAGELAVDGKPEIISKVANLMVWVLENDDNGVVKHEACYQIAARDMRDKIPNLLNTALYDNRIVARHEAIEALGLMRATEVRNDIQKALNDKNYDVRETAQFVLKRLDRVSGKENYSPSEIL